MLSASPRFRGEALGIACSRRRVPLARLGAVAGRANVGGRRSRRGRTNTTGRSLPLEVPRPPPRRPAARIRYPAPPTRRRDDAKFRLWRRRAAAVILPKPHPSSTRLHFTGQPLRPTSGGGPCSPCAGRSPLLAPPDATPDARRDPRLPAAAAEAPAPPVSFAVASAMRDSVGCGLKKGAAGGVRPIPPCCISVRAETARCRCNTFSLFELRVRVGSRPLFRLHGCQSPSRAWCRLPLTSLTSVVHRAGSEQ